MNWNPNGTLNIDGTPLKDTNVIDIVNSAVRARKTAKLPDGSRELIRFLQDRNPPKEIFGNKSWIQRLNTSYLPPYMFRSGNSGTSLKRQNTEYALPYPAVKQKRRKPNQNITTWSMI